MAYASHLYGDPMTIAAGNQARERRQAAEPRRQPVKNSPLPEFPRRWESAEGLPHKPLEAFLTEESQPRPWSEARKALEALFENAP